ncbi:solute carrier family 25 member 35-like [Gigantopelta aegis]|uniref:solute carrier family 25 member 35-like n=1 Tax=Gigantopelta aegis TaxID=1735272 RepID=UPI001B889253|nr:solute carrier family 25 member 35-like [Gigantopelta aegis]XP_041378289.1 solute carrier family 25 member 35-like [Gigantopelta aegis]
MTTQQLTSPSVSKHETRVNHVAIEFVLGGIATCGACCFTNPLEVIKTRMQLQGELKAKGQYAVHYRNAAHAFYTIAKTDGILALQSGLVPALWYQFFMNGLRLGSYQVLVNLGLTTDKHGKVSFLQSVLAGAMAGCVGSAVGSPFYMIKTHLQSKAAKEIAVGHQHSHESMSHGLIVIYKQFGIIGLWRGVTAAMTRVTVGSAAQLATFSKMKEKIVQTKTFHPDSWVNALVASMCSGVIVTLVMTPFDVISTRMYNQGTSAGGKGLLYTGVVDCFLKIFNKEGVWGFYKGWGPSYLRLGPHTVLTLVFWDEIRKFYSRWKNVFKF